MIELAIVAVALALDATAVAAAMAAGGVAWSRLTLAAVSFGVFQALMSGIGAAGGSVMTAYAAAWDHWVAFVLLAIVGGRMVWGTGGDDDEPPSATLAVILTASVATSIDALAAGVSLPLLAVPAWVSVLVIGLVTAALAVGAAGLGRQVGGVLGRRAEQVAGLVLIAIGVKIVVEHTLLA